MWVTDEILAERQQKMGWSPCNKIKDFSHLAYRNNNGYIQSAAPRRTEFNDHLDPEMKKLDAIQYITGFLMGVFFGFIAEGIPLIACGLLYKWFGRAQYELTLWMLLLMLPIPLVMGLLMGKLIASMHMEDY